MDLLKSLISILIATAVTLYFVDDISNAREQDRHKWQVKFELQSKAITQFEKSSYAFISNSEEAIKLYSCERHRNNKKKPTEIVVWETQLAYDLNYSIDSLRLWLGKQSVDLESHFENLSKLQSDLVKLRDIIFITEECPEGYDFVKKIFFNSNWVLISMQN